MLFVCLGALVSAGCDEVEDHDDDLEADAEFRAVSALEYCATLDMILANNELTGDAQVGAAIGWNEAHCNQFSPVELWNNWPINQ